MELRMLYHDSRPNTSCPTFSDAHEPRDRDVHHFSSEGG